MNYTEGFKASIVEKLTAPGGPSAMQLSKELGIAQPTLSRWVRAASKVGVMKKKQGNASARRPQEWPAEEKLSVVMESAPLEGEDLGALLRRRGVHQVQLESWRRQMLAGLETPSSKGSPSSASARRVRELERELRRKEKALAEAAALLILQKKVRAIWGDEDESTAGRSAS